MFLKIYTIIVLCCRETFKAFPGHKSLLFAECLNHQLRYWFWGLNHAHVRGQNVSHRKYFSFSFFSGLNLSANRMSSLPDELSEMTQLESVDISNNSFISLPDCLFKAPKMVRVMVNKNFVAGAYSNKDTKGLNTNVYLKGSIQNTAKLKYVQIS